MGSTRLPGKILALVEGHPLLAHVLRRLRRMREADEIVVATTTRSDDDPVRALADEEGVRYFRGDEQDVLSRYLGAAREVNADMIVRVTGDCPLIDPLECDKVVLALVGNVDYASNVLERTYPRGLDAEALHRDVLERAARLARSPKAREHVTWFIHREKPDLFVIRSVRDGEDNSDLRWTVDVPEDLDLVRRIYSDLGLAATSRAYREILSHVRAHPDLGALNAGIAQKDG